MYEYQSKKIETLEELEDVCRKTTSYFVGAFMLEMIVKRKEWENPETKNAFVDYMFTEYLYHWPKSRVRNRINLMIRIIESNMVEKALEYVAGANPHKLDDPEIIKYAEDTLNMIKTGKLDVKNGVIHYERK